MPIVSIVVTCYNYGRYIAGCLTSILEQTFTDYEVIVVDDGSTDNSIEEICPFLQDSRFRLIEQANAGQAVAKNRGIRESRGQFIAFLDADDLWLPEKLKKQVALFGQKSVGVVFSGVSWIDAEGRTLGRDVATTYLQPRRGRVAEWLVYDNFVPFSSVVVRRDCIDTFGMFDETLAMGIDWDLWLRLATNYSFEYCEEPFLLYRVGHSGQMSKNILVRLECADRIIDKFRQHFPDAVSEKKIKDAAYYSCCVRGYVLRHYGVRYSLTYYFRALSLYPFRWPAYVGLLKVPIRMLFRRE